MKYNFLIVVVLALLVAGCVQKDPLSGYCKDNERAMVVCEPIPEIGDQVGENETNTVIIIEDMTTTTLKPKSTMVYSAEFTYEEGDFVDLSILETEDPDEDDVHLTFGEPLNEEGMWQTKQGDLGDYTVKVIASDGKADTIAYVMLRVVKKNLPPVLVVESTSITVYEGDTIYLKAYASDPEEEDVIITYSGWMTSSEYTTTYEDEGEYTVTITASDGFKKVSKDVTITVKNKNRPPVIEQPTYDIIAVEGDLIGLKINAYSPEGKDVKLKFGKPFDKEGKWKTGKGDAGEYMIEVIASDGEDETSIEVPVFVEKLNNPPILQYIEPITVNEGETIKIMVKAIDADGDNLNIVFSGWMKQQEYETGYDDQGEHIVIVTVSDGIASVSQDVVITVIDVNRPPVFVWR